MPLWTSCLTNHTVKIETVLYVPDLYFPDFPKLQKSVCIPYDADGKQVNEDNNVEIMYYVVAPHYITNLANFKVQYDVTKAQYIAAKKLYSQE